MQEDSSQTSVPGDPPSRPARFGDVGPWGIRGTSGLGSPPPERPTPPGGGGCGGRSIVRRQLPSRGPAQPLQPQIRSRAREGKKNAAVGPLGMQFSDLTEERRRGKGFRP